MAEKNRVLVRTVINDKRDVESRLQAAICMIHHLEEKLTVVEDELVTMETDLETMTDNFERAKQELMNDGKYGCSFCKEYFYKEDITMCPKCPRQLCDECCLREAEEIGIEKTFYGCSLFTLHEKFCYKCASDELKEKGNCPVCILYRKIYPGDLTDSY